MPNIIDTFFRGLPTKLIPVAGLNRQSFVIAPSARPNIIVAAAKSIIFDALLYIYIYTKMPTCNGSSIYDSISHFLAPPTTHNRARTSPIHMYARVLYIYIRGSCTSKLNHLSACAVAVMPAQFCEALYFRAARSKHSLALSNLIHTWHTLARRAMCRASAAAAAAPSIARAVMWD